MVGCARLSTPCDWSYLRSSSDRSLSIRELGKWAAGNRPPFFSRRSACGRERTWCASQAPIIDRGLRKLPRKIQTVQADTWGSRSKSRCALLRGSPSDGGCLRTSVDCESAKLSCLSRSGIIKLILSGASHTDNCGWAGGDPQRRLRQSAWSRLPIALAIRRR